MRLLVALAALAPATALAERESDPQPHEVRVNIDVEIKREENGAFLDGVYTFTPGKAIDRTDEVVPILRRFVRHPSALWFGISRDGNTREQVTGARLGGILQLFNGRVFGSAEGAIESDNVDYDFYENGYYAARSTLELGFRPVDLVAISGFWLLRPVLSAKRDDNLIVQAERSGSEQQYGLSVSTSTPNDRVYATLSAWLVNTDWTFKGFHAGDVTVRGFGLSGRVAFQLSSSFTVQLRAHLGREHWRDKRLGDEGIDFVGPDIDRTPISAGGVAEIVYWYKGRLGFRVSFGGGYEGSKPQFQSLDTAVIRFGLGFVTRF